MYVPCMVSHAHLLASVPGLPLKNNYVIALLNRCICVVSVGYCSCMATVYVAAIMNLHTMQMYIDSRQHCVCMYYVGAGLEVIWGEAPPSHIRHHEVIVLSVNVTALPSFLTPENFPGV